MKYDNTKSKLRKIWSQSNTNKYEIINQQETNKRIKQTNENFHRLTSKNIVDLSTDWDTMLPPSDDTTISAWGASKYRIQWDVELKEMPIKLIPFIKYQVVYKINGEEGYIEEELSTYNPQVPVLFRLEDIKNSSGAVIEDFKKVTMMVGYIFQSYTQHDSPPPIFDIQAKLIIKLYNPELII